jgi:hypothetical protein
MSFRRFPRARRKPVTKGRQAFQSVAESMEERLLLSYADGNGPVVTNLAEQNAGGHSYIIISFDGPLNPTSAQNTSNYRVNALAPGSIENVTTAGPANRVLSVQLDATGQVVTLALASPLPAGLCERVVVNGSTPTAVTDTSGTPIDGDNDDTAGGDFYGLIAYGKSLSFTDNEGDRATLGIVGPGSIQLWRLINGDANQLTILNAAPGHTTLTG